MIEVLEIKASSEECCEFVGKRSGFALCKVCICCLQFIVSCDSVLNRLVKVVKISSYLCIEKLTIDPDFECWQGLHSKLRQ